MDISSSRTAFYKQGRVFLRRLPHQVDLLQWLSNFALENQIEAATILIIGAVTKATVAYYNQQQKVYRQISLETNLEILSCAGNISIRENKPFIHCHATFSDSEGRTFGGHLAEGTVIFAAEAWVQELLGAPPVREQDVLTGLSLWKEV